MQSMEPPGLIAGANMYAFLVPGDHAKMQAFVDKHLNVAPKATLEYKVIGSTNIAVFVEADRLTSTSQSVGWVPDNEFAFFMLLVAFEDGVATRIVTYNPYIVVDTGIALVSGRESWGFPKEAGLVTSPDLADHDRRWIAQATLFSVLDADTEGVLQAWFQIRSAGPWDASQGLEKIWKTIEDARAGIEKLIGAFEDESHAESRDLIEALIANVKAASIPQANLKQFRDAEEPTKACYQAIIESASTIRKIYGGGLLLGKHTSRVTPAESHPLGADLGLKASDEIGIGFWLRVDFIAEDGKTVWP